MLTCLLNNLQLMGILIAMYVGAFGANTLLGIYSNLAQAKEQFSKEKLIQGLIRGAIVLVGSLLITVIISLLPDTLTALGISVEELKKTWQRQAAARTRLNKIRSRKTSGNLISRRFFHMVLRFCCGSCGIVEQIKIM